MKNSDSATLMRVIEIMKRELTAGLIIIMIIVLISGCGGGGGGGSSGGGYDSPERKEARNKINDVKEMIDDCEIVIETAEKVGVKSSLIKPAREGLINANERIRDANNNYNSGNYNGAKSDAESAESYVKSAKEYAESQIKQLRDEVKVVLKETEANIISSENYIKINSDIGNNTITAMELINFAKDEIESAWTKYDEEKYGVALGKCKKAKSYSVEAKNMVELAVEKSTKKTIDDITTPDVCAAEKRVKEVGNAGVSIPSAKSKLYDAMDYLKMAEKNYEQGEYKKAQANAVKASRLAIESKDDADRRLENFVESDLVMLRKDIRDVEDKIDNAQLLGISTDNEERQVEDVESLRDDAESCKLAGDEELLSAARYITDGKNCLMDIDESLNKKMEWVRVIFIGAAVAVFFVFIVIFGKRRGK